MLGPHDPQPLFANGPRVFGDLDAQLSRKILSGQAARRIGDRDYVLEFPIHADYALIKADRADRWGNLVYRKTARNFAPIMAAAARCTVVQVRETVELGSLDPEAVVTPGIFVKRIVRISSSLQKAA